MTCTWSAGLTEELENRYDRHGELLEGHRTTSTRQLERERLAERLELSSREVTLHQVCGRSRYSM